jgi:hypothetical protein
MEKVFASLISMMLVLGVITTGQANSGERPSTSAPPMQRGAGAVRFAPRQIQEANRKLRYTIKARYPQAIGAGRDPRLAKLNQELKQFIDKEVGGFKKDFSAPEERMFGGESTFDSRYLVEFATNDLVSIGFVINTYFEGAAHGNYNVIVFNYDLNSGRSLRLSDLFKPNSNYLSLISDYAIKSLRKQAAPDPDLDWIRSGAGPEEKNYQSWNITRKGLEVTFNPYQVASYAEGPKVVTIPYPVLKNIIDPNGLLSAIAGQQKGRTR